MNPAHGALFAPLIAGITFVGLAGFARERVQDALDRRRLRVRRSALVIEVDYADRDSHGQFGVATHEAGHERAPEVATLGLSSAV